MRNLRWTKSFGKDVKRLTKRKYQLSKLHRVIEAIRSGEPLPLTARPHLLHGEWAGMWECHIAPDLLLIYGYDEAEVGLYRTGTHADLFE